MINNYYNRYGQFRKSDEISYIPFITIDSKPTDIKIVWNKRNRLDKVSQEYYGTPYYGWLILLANPKFGGMEFDIPENTILRIPFPLMDSLQNYQKKVESYKTLNGNE
jgi:hypothetical protein